jgi:phosphatidylserine/phosphatidylglycerophosphate/cardiolipin synthase-like enzyme
MRRQKTRPGRSALAAAGLALLLPALAAGGIETRFNSVERLEKYVKGAFSEAVSSAKDGKPATIDIMIFSFTSPSLSDSLLRIARDYPSVKIRIIANLSQLFREPTSVVPDIEGIASGKVEAYRTVADRRKAFIKDPAEHKLAVDSELKQVISEYRQKPLPNVELKYKWFPAFSWEDKLGKADYDQFHPKPSLLHHKVAIINGETLVTGSYNWSNYAETKNLENLMIVRGPENRALVADFEAEFEAMWNDPSLTKTSGECRELKDSICAGIDREHAKEPGTRAPGAPPADKSPNVKTPAMKTGD